MYFPFTTNNTTFILSHTAQDDTWLTGAGAPRSQVALAGYVFVTGWTKNQLCVETERLCEHVVKPL